MAASVQDRLVTLARRLSVGRILRYLDLWARYLFRRALGASAGHQAGLDEDGGALPAALGEVDFGGAKRLAVASWFPVDRANTRLHQAILSTVASARPDLGLQPDVIDCLMRLKAAEDLSAEVDAEVESGTPRQTLNTALYLLLLRRLPAPSEHAMIASRHPRNALIAIRSGDEYRKQGRRMALS